MREPGLIRPDMPAEEMPAQLPRPDSAAVHELAQVLLTDMQQDIDTRIDWRLQQGRHGRRDISQNEVGMALGSLGIAIPLCAIAAAAAGFAGLLVVVIGIVAVNMAWTLRR